MTDRIIAIVAPMTGGNAAFGAQVREGALQAFADLRPTGFVPSVYDDRSDIGTGLTVAHQIIEDGAVAVIGHSNSYISIPASDLYAAAGLLQISPVTSHPDYTARELWNTFRTCGTDAEQGPVIAAHMVQSGLARAALITDSTEYGDSLVKAVDEGLMGRAVTGLFSLDRGQIEFAALCRDIAAMAPDTIFFGGDPTEAGHLVRAFAATGLDQPFYVCEGIASQRFVDVGGAAVSGTRIAVAPDPAAHPAASCAVERLTARGFLPEGNTLMSYAAMQVLLAGFQATDGDTRSVANWLKSSLHNTVLGEIEFTAEGDLRPTAFCICEWRQNGTKIDYRGNVI
ncbi:MAG: branched-chain amino acid ABC transporter substrate-binding protein [Pseudomonadota bacterium]